MSGWGIVSRVTPVHTAVRNCTRDEGGPFEVGNQVLISSHRKLLSSKASAASQVEGLTFLGLFEGWIKAGAPRPSTINRWRAVFLDLQSHFVNRNAGSREEGSPDAHVQSDGSSK
jgi:hypothetical protein